MAMGPAVEAEEEEKATSKQWGESNRGGRMAHEEKENGGVAATSGKGRLKAVDANSGNWDGNSRVEKPTDGHTEEELGGMSTAALAEKKRALKIQLKR